MTRRNEDEIEPLRLVWIDCPYPVVAIGLTRIAESKARVHVGRKAPTEESPSVTIFATDGMKGLSEGIKRLQEANPDTPILVFGPHLDLPLARAALQEGARGFIHAEMQPEQIIRALEVVAKGQIAAPRELLEYLITDYLVGPNTLSTRQREILKLVGEGLSNAQIAEHLFLAESTVKQHLSSAYKRLGVSNRTEAAKLVRSGALEEPPR